MTGEFFGTCGVAHANQRACRHSLSSDASLSPISASIGGRIGREDFPKYISTSLVAKNRVSIPNPAAASYTLSTFPLLLDRASLLRLALHRNSKIWEGGATCASARVAPSLPHVTYPAPRHFLYFQANAFLFFKSVSYTCIKASPNGGFHFVVYKHAMSSKMY
jgi:hypothetical protein